NTVGWSVIDFIMDINSSIGINKLSFSNPIKIYPNPVLNTLRIESEQYFEAGTEIEITNTLGQTVLKRSFNKEIDLTQFSSGYYTLKIISPNSAQIISKFIKD
ncbi:MAG TPA: T9SS type A sorting domain-containing protein, partial [Bacteroidia bacterium]|nr:T9SS type A sorting domain-containing protein [Bacteroidia bacterium]